MTRPNFFIVGAPKSGTSAMYTYLNQHPQVYMSRQKELHFFGTDLHRINHVPFIPAQYLAFFADAGDELIVGEASTSYLQSRSAAEELKAFAPAARILIMLRNPVDVMYAYHGTHLFSGFETIADFEAALAAESERRRGLSWPTRPGIVELLWYREVVRYSEQVERYFKMFGRDAVHVLLYDDFRRDTAASYREVLGFLGVSPEFAATFRIVNPSRRVRSPRLQRFLLQPPPVFHRVLRTIFPDSLRRRVVGRVARINTTYEERPPLAQELRCRLLAELTPEIRRLSVVLGCDLSTWIQDEQPLVRSGLPVDRMWPPPHAS